MEERFPVPGFGVSQVDDTDKLSRCAVVSQKLIQMGMFKAGVRAGLPIRRDRRVAIRVIPSSPDLFNVNCGHLLFHELCSTGFRIWGHSFECAICLRSMCSRRRSALPAPTRNGGKCWRKWPAKKGTRPCSVAGRIGIGERSWTTPSGPGDGSKNGGTSVITRRGLWGAR